MGNPKPLHILVGAVDEAIRQAENRLAIRNADRFNDTITDHVQIENLQHVRACLVWLGREGRTPFKRSLLRRLREVFTG